MHSAVKSELRKVDDFAVFDLAPDFKRFFFRLFFLSAYKGDDIVDHFRHVSKVLPAPDIA